jgi:hypothetical protein
MSNVPELSNSHDFLSLDQIVSHAMQEQLLVLDSSLSVLATGKMFYRAFRATPGATVGKKLADLGNGQWN